MGSWVVRMEINLPNVRAEVEAVFAEYEAALVNNDVETLNRLFLDSPHTIRYGIAENNYGYAEIAAFRAACPPIPERTLEDTHITTYGQDLATVWTLFRRSSLPDKIGRQSQVWNRTPHGWRVVAAHVSMIPDDIVNN